MAQYFYKMDPLDLLDFDNPNGQQKPWLDQLDPMEV